MFSNKLGTELISEKNNPRLNVNHLSQACLLKGKPIIENLERWCFKHNQLRDGVKPMLAVIYFDTGSDARDYLQIKAEVAAKAGIDYSSHKLLPHASINEVLNKIKELNKDNRIHGILVQRPVPEHLDEHEVMYNINRQKHIEECTRGKDSNIAVDGVERLLDAYHKVQMLDLYIIILGGTNIITPEFKAELKHRFQYVKILSTLEGTTIDCKRNTVIMTELNKGGIIKPTMLGPNVKLIIDLGFDVDTKTGDLDPGCGPQAAAVQGLVLNAPSQEHKQSEASVPARNPAPILALLL
ncbi:methylenetetrahydrofolate dehydrogenase (NADP(+)), partial [Colletotrichum tofieldiae]